MPKQVLFLVTALFLSPIASKAEETASSTASSEGSFLKRYGKANYLMWLTGPRTEALSGNKDGTGSNIDVRHFFTFGGKLSSEVSLTVTQYGLQHFNEKPESEQKHFSWKDPYLTLSHSKLLSDEAHGFNLDGYARYYVPVSRDTHDGMNSGFLASDGGPNDISNGMMRLYLNPALALLDGKLNLTATSYMNFKFSKFSAQERFDRQVAQLQRTGGDPGEAKSFREDAYFVFDPVATYSVSSKLDVYLEYSTGYLRHSTDGKWTSVRHPEDGQSVGPGLYWNPNKKLSINPYISWGPVFEGLTKADLGLQVQYTFL